MRVVVHLSDLHFGRIDAALIDPLHAAIAALQPCLIAVSGDLTQRARRRQFRHARAFLDALPAPRIVVPGNHDVPLYDVARRFLRPLARYRRYIDAETEPFFADGEIAVAGLNTARSLALQGGRLNRRQLERMRARLAGVDGETVRIVVMHHPLATPAGFEHRKRVGRAPLAVEALAAAGVDVCLAGHLHVEHVGRVAEHYEAAGRDVLLVQAGTATSTRGRGEANSFNALRVERGALQIERHAWQPHERRFRRTRSQRFRRAADGWHPAPAID